MKKISELTKKELLPHMIASREIYRFDSESKAWQRAFQLYRDAQGVRLDMDCGKCVGKVRDWMKEK